MSTLKSYSIALDIENSDQINSELKQINESFKTFKTNINNISLDNDILDSLQEMSASIKKAGDEGKDVSKQIEAFSRQAKSLTDELSKQATQINYSLSAEGKAMRERLKVLSEKQTLTKEEQKEQKKLSKLVIQGSDEELKSLLLINKEIRINAKMKSMQLQTETKAGKQLQTIQQKETKVMDKKIKQQKEYNKTLADTQKKQGLLNKVAGYAKTGLKVGAGMVFAGAGMALAGAYGAAQKAVDDENAVRRIKGAFTESERKEILMSVRSATGADTKTVVDAINRVSHIIKFSNTPDVISAAINEVKNPGMAALFQASSKQGGKAKDWGTFSARIRGVQQFTGVDSNDAMQKARQSRLGGNRFSHDQYFALYAALQGSGAFQNQETMEKALESFMNHADPTKDIFKQLKEYNFSRFVWRAQDRNALRKGLESIDDIGLNRAMSVGGGSELAPSAAERTLAKARELEEKRDQLYIKILNSGIFDKILKIVDDLISSGKVEKILDKAIIIFDKFFDELMDIASAPLWKTMLSFLDFTPSSAKAVEKMINKLPTEDSRQTTQKSSGGLTHGRELVGERGQELVIPLSWSRQGRATQIVQTFQQTFNLQGTQTTGLSLGQAVKGQGSFSRAFIDARVY